MNELTKVELAQCQRFRSHTHAQGRFPTQIARTMIAVEKQGDDA